MTYVSEHGGAWAERVRIERLHGSSARPRPCVANAVITAMTSRTHKAQLPQKARAEPRPRPSPRDRASGSAARFPVPREVFRYKTWGLGGPSVAVTCIKSPGLARRRKSAQSHPCVSSTRAGSGARKLA
eukprot:5685523-Prymnesium_polylepis.1